MVISFFGGKVLEDLMQKYMVNL